MRPWTVPLILLVSLIALVVTMPLWFPVVLVLHYIHRSRLRKAADSFACVTCGKTLGTDALRRADEACAEHMRELQRQHPGARFRIARTLDAICVGCGTRYEFRERERTFVVRDARRD